MAFPLTPASPGELGLRAENLELLCRLIEAQIAEGRYPGAQVAVARHGRLALFRSFGQARLEPAAQPAHDDTLWLLYSNTKVVTAAAIWLLVEEGKLTFHDRIADHVPEFARHNKGEITLFQVLTHQAGFPSQAAPLPAAALEDHARMRQAVCDFTLEWTPGSRLEYHRLAAHWVAAMLIEAVTGQDFRAFIRERIILPLGLGEELYVGLADELQARAADMHAPAESDGRQEKLTGENTALFRRAGVPGGGGYATARAMAAFYQMMLQGGRLNGTRLFSPRLISFVTRDFTGDRVDDYMGLPMHRGLGPHSRGLTPVARGLGTIADPSTFGHGGVGSSYCWADPASGVSFAYLSNSRVPDPWHSRRLDILSGCVHGAIEN